MEEKPTSIILLGSIVIGLVVLAHLALSAESARLAMLRVVLVFSAVGEMLGGVSNVFRCRSFAESNGRPYHPAYHGVMQDFGFYNLAFVGLFGLAALDPARSAPVIGVAIALYTLHAGSHVFRYFGLYYGGGTPIPTRPQRVELRDGLTLVAAVTGMVLFFP